MTVPGRAPGRAPRAFLALAGLLALTACATAASPDQMSLAPGAAPAIADGDRGYHALRVGKVDGGSDTTALWMSDVGNADLRTALETSLRGVGYLAADPAAGAYEVTATIVDLDRPTVSKDPALLVVPIDLSVTVQIHYTVRPAGGGPPVFDELVAATGTATANQAITPDGRVRKAAEAAVRADIQAFVQRLKAQWK